jgi:hypothetical protein
MDFWPNLGFKRKSDDTSYRSGVSCAGDLKAQIAKENDAARLQGLVIEINALLDLIEIQLTKIERRQGSAKD